MPRNVMFKHALGNSVDLLALKILLQSRFKPATVNGLPIAFGCDAEMKLHICIEQQPGSSSSQTAWLSVPPEEKLKNWRHAPAEANLAPLHMPADAIADDEHPAKSGFTEPKIIAHRMYDARGKSGTFSFGMLIDEYGIGHIGKVLVSTNPALLPVATAMILSIRRIPAMKDGMPVPVHMIETLKLTSLN